MRNTFAYDIDKWMQSEEGQEDMKKTKTKIMRMLEDPKTPNRRKAALSRTISFIDLYLIHQ